MNLCRYSRFKTQTHYAKQWRFCHVSYNFNTFRDLYFKTKTNINLSFGIWGLAELILWDFDPTRSFNLCIHDKKFQGGIGSTKDILIIISFPIWVRDLWVLKWISDFVIRSFFSTDSVYFKDILFILEIIKWSVDFLFFKSIINLFLSFALKLLAYLFRFKLLFF